METGKFVCGDTVWVKIPNCPWWPAEVIDEKDCPIPLPNPKTKRKPVVASIKFLAEDQYYFITSLDNIQPFLVPHYKELKLKGERDKRECLRSKFGAAFRQGLERVGLLPVSSHDDVTSPLAPDVAECPSSELPSGPRFRKPVEKFGVTLPPSPKPKRGVKRTRSVGSTTPSKPKSRNCSMSESPSIPYPCETKSESPSIPYPCERKSDKLNGLDRVGVQNRLVESVNAVKRSLESDYIFASHETGFRLAESIGVTCKLSPVKTISDSFTCLSHRGEATYAENEEEQLISGKGVSTSSFNSNLSSESDSDEDLPEGISPSITATTGMPDVRDVIWVKYRKNPFWPAVVRRIQKRKKRGRSKKIQVQFLGDTGHFKESFYLTYNKATVLPLDNPHRKEFEANGESFQDPDLKKRFKSSLAELEAYLNKKALGLLPPDKEDSFFDEDYTSDSPDEVLIENKQSEHPCSQTTMSTVSPRTERWEKKQSRICENMKENRKKKNQALIEHLLSEEMKAYVLDIYHERRKSDLHSLYKLSARERESLKYSGFGPIADEEQQDLVTYQFVEWYKSEISTTVDINYILDVLVPEAVVYSLIKRRKYGKSRAWEMFHKGYQPYRAEQKQIHNHLIKTASNISPSDRQLYDERRQERWQMMLTG